MKVNRIYNTSKGNLTCLRSLKITRINSFGFREYTKTLSDKLSKGLKRQGWRVI